MKTPTIYNFALMAAGYLFLLLLLTGQHSNAASYESCGCHPYKAEKKVFHKPVGEGKCELCHKPSGEKHPRFKKEAFILADNGKSGLCNECHRHMDTMKFVHGPVGSGDCLACHDAHQSDNKYLLRAPGGQLCFMCHEKSQYDRKYPHPPIADGNCTGCHDPHQSDVKFLLKGDGMQLCIICHDKNMFQGKSVHGPIKKGECTACHSTHGTQYRALLRRNFSDEFYMPFNKENFDLCFGCHNNQMADDLLTDTQTNLRNGLTNIHYIHINKKEKGRSCKVCHDPHAAAQPRLISEKIPGFGQWKIPIRFTKTDTGGTCIVGCHKPKSYDRIDPVINP